MVRQTRRRTNWQRLAIAWLQNMNRPKNAAPGVRAMMAGLPGAAARTALALLGRAVSKPNRLRLLRLTADSLRMRRNKD